MLLLLYLDVQYVLLARCLLHFLLVARPKSGSEPIYYTFSFHFLLNLTTFFISLAPLFFMDVIHEHTGSYCSYYTI